MNRLPFLHAVVIFLLFICCVLSAKVDRPNIIVIMTDDQGVADAGFQGSNDILTPNLDQLAYNGLIFTNGYVAHPVCGPSRAALLTGRYPHRYGLQVNIPFSPIDSNYGVPLSERFFTRDLQQVGYTTGVIGKWHLGATPEFHPNNRGFDFFYGFLGGGHDFFPEDYAGKRPWHMQNLLKEDRRWPHPEAFSYILPLERNGEWVEETEYLTDVLTREGVGFIERNKDHPFFLYLAYNAPHKPLEAKVEDLALFPDIKAEKRRTYAAMIYAVDRGVGEIIEKLETEGLLEKTLIVFLSDNGGISREPDLASNEPFSGGKGETLEGGYRVPFFAYWSGRIEPQRSDEIVASLDLYPTFLDLAGVTITEERELDGYNLRPFLLGEQKESPRNYMIARRWLGQHHTYGYRKQQWKLNEISRSGRRTLHDLSTDLAEAHDLSEEYPEITNKMIKEHNEWNAENIEPLWIEPGWYWPNNEEHGARVIDSFRERLYEYGDPIDPKGL